MRWYYWDGDAVEVELYVASGEKGVFVRIEEITVGEWEGFANHRPRSGLSYCLDNVAVV